MKPFFTEDVALKSRKEIKNVIASPFQDTKEDMPIH